MVAKSFDNGESEEKLECVGQFVHEQSKPDSATKVPSLTGMFIKNKYIEKCIVIINYRVKKFRHIATPFIYTMCSNYNSTRSTALLFVKCYAKLKSLVPFQQ